MLYIFYRLSISLKLWIVSYFIFSKILKTGINDNMLSKKKSELEKLRVFQIVLILIAFYYYNIFFIVIYLFINK